MLKGIKQGSETDTAGNRVQRREWGRKHIEHSPLASGSNLTWPLSSPMTWGNDSTCCIYFHIYKMEEGISPVVEDTVERNATIANSAPRKGPVTKDAKYMGVSSGKGRAPRC